MKLISLNVALFEQNNSQLADFFKAQQADILCLQEVTKRLDASASPAFISKDSIDQHTAQLSENFFAPIWVLSKFEKKHFHGQEHFQFDLGGKAEFGNYCKSRFPILKGQNVFVQNHFTYVTDWSAWPEEDYRAVQVIDLQLPTSKLRVLNYHGIWSQDKQGNQKTLLACQQLKELALSADGPAIICGDFNLFPDTPSCQVFAEDFIDVGTKYQIKTTRPASNELSNTRRNVVDYVFTTKDILIKDFAVPNLAISDHLPLLLEFEIANSKS